MVKGGGANYYTIFTDNKDERIAELEEEVEKLKAGGSKGGGGGGEARFAPISQLQQEIDYLEQRLRESKSRNMLMEDELELLRSENDRMQSTLKNIGVLTHDKAMVESMRSQLEVKNHELLECRNLIDELHKVGWANLPQKVQDECKNANKMIEDVKKSLDEARAAENKAKVEFNSMKDKAENLQKAYEKEKEACEQMKKKLQQSSSERENAIKKVHKEWEEKEAKRISVGRKQVEALEYQIAQLKLQAIGSTAQRLSTGSVRPPEHRNSVKSTTSKTVAKAAPAAAPAAAAPASGASSEDVKKLCKQVEQLKTQNLELLSKLKALEGSGAADQKKNAEQADFWKKKIDEKEKEIEKLQKEVKHAASAAKEKAENEGKAKELEKTIEALKKENKTLLDNYQAETTLRKKYYNMVEDMKGKIRVYVRARPISKSEEERGNVMCVTFNDEFTINVNGPKGTKEFQFDRVFAPADTQEMVFEDTSNLIQSAFDGYNVCIFAYGQTGSGKTHTLIGNPQLPGVTPKAFTKIYKLIQENSKKFNFKISAFMLELYNDKLLDLFASSATHSDKLDIKKDTKGFVFVPGAEFKEAKSESDLNKIFELGNKNRHVASTKMNSESSRSHLVLSVLIESENTTTKKTSRGKLSIIDLAGSERVAKTGATEERLKEANSINMSLSALGDVIAALTSDESFVPYRNNKLTMLMQDSLGGNAKTLMFCNISPVDYNSAESINSLNYASRVKLVKNDATKNVDNEEITKLKKQIEVLKKGGKVE